MAAEPMGPDAADAERPIRSRLAWLREPVRRWIVGVALALSLTLVAAVVLFLLHVRQEALRDGVHDAGVMAQQLAQDAERVLSEADAQIAALEDWLQHQGIDSPAAFERVALQSVTHEWLRDATIRSSAIGGMLLVSADGRRLASSRIFPAPQTDLSDREYFQRLRDATGRTQVITEALKNRQSGLDTVIVMVRIEAADGRLVGMAGANIPAPRFVRSFEAAGEQGLQVALIRRSGEPVVSDPAISAQIRELLPQRLTALKAAWAQPGGAAWSVLDVSSSEDDRLLLTQPLVAYPMALLGILPTSPLTEAWRETARASGALLGMALLVLWGAVWLALRQVALGTRVRKSEQLQAIHQTLVEKVAELDDSKRKLAEANDGLEFRVALRTEQLSLALLQAQHANEAKSRFLSSISHELRTPLNAVLGFAQVLRDGQAGSLDNQQKEYVQRIESAAEYLLSLMNDLLDLGGVEQNLVQIRPEPVKLQTVLRSVVEKAEPMARDMAVALVLDELSETWGVQADPVRLHQVLLNLITNAIKYNHRGGDVRIHCRTVSQEADTPAMAIEIADSGPGLTEQQVAQLFQPFNRLGAEQTAIQGTGIGLVIARRLTEMMHGRIEVCSSPGKGTRFTVTLPAAPAQAVSEPASADASAPSSAPSSDLQVLYVEDHASNIALVEAICKDRPGVALSLARSGHEALETLAAQTPALLLVDMNLGDMTGLQLKALLDQRGLAAGVRLVALSADAMPEQIQAARAAGFDDYLTKPLRVRELLAQFERTRRDLDLQAPSAQAAGRP